MDNNHKRHVHEHDGHFSVLAGDPLLQGGQDGQIVVDVPFEHGQHVRGGVVQRLAQSTH